jgi:replicative DNA helicase
MQNRLNKKLKNNFMAAKDIIFDTYLEIENKYNGKISGISTGFTALDSALNGLQGGQLIVITAQAGHEKRAFALNIAQNIAIREAVPVGIFSLDIPQTKIMQQILASEGNLSTLKLKEGNLNVHDLQKLANAMNIVNDTPIFINDSIGLTLSDILGSAKLLKEKIKDLGLIVIDNLQMIFENKDYNTSASILKGLKILAKELNLPLILLSQLPSNKPVSGEFNEIKLFADVILLVHKRFNKKRKTLKNIRTISILKKNEQPKSITLEFLPNIGKFKNMNLK